MDFPKALCEVYNQNASFWRKSHNSIAEMSGSWSVSCNSRANAHEWDMSQSAVLSFLNTQLLAAIESIVTAVSCGKTNMKAEECNSEDVQRGGYEPPTIPESLPKENMAKHWLARPANDIDIDSILVSLCSCEA